jgi:glucosylceramidase
MTTGDRSQLLRQQPDAEVRSKSMGVNGLVIEVDASQRYQTMVGFGASLTDATAWLMQRVQTAEQRAALLSELFGRGPQGVGFEFTRLTIGASDFSRSHYSFNDRPAGQTDLDLTQFSLEAQRGEVIPLVKQALAVNPRLQIMASAWSAPGWMKTTDSLIKGALKPGMEDVFSRYLVKYVDAMASEGIPVFALTLQNEPHFEPDDYPGMRLDNAARAKVLGQYLGPLLERQGKKVQLIEWDHNWDDPSAPLAVLADPLARRYASGVGWHCYAGEPAVQSRVHDAYPDKDTWFTECSGGEWKPFWPETLPWMARTIVIGTTRNWARGVLMWNMALDENHGPHLGGCKDCRGMVTIDSKTGAVTRNLEYYALAHASKFVEPGAQRIASTSGVDSVDTVAFQNPKGGSLVLVVCNSAPQSKILEVRQSGRSIELTLPRESVATVVWAP